MSITENLAEFMDRTGFSDLPPEVVQTAKECLIDTFGGALAGTKYPDVVGITKELKKYDHQPDCTVWGTQEKFSLLNAVLLNGTMGHATEMDDVHKIAKTHAGTVLVPAAVTFCETLKSSGRDLLRAVALGYEAALRIGMGIGATNHRLKGWHATGTCGIFGSAAASAILLGHGRQKLVSTLGLAGTQASGLWAFTEDGASCKKFHAGKAAHGGALAALLSSGGMTGPRSILEAKDGGLFPASSDGYDYTVITRELGTAWEILNVDRKPFACCRSMHPSIDAVLQLEEQYGIKPDDIEQIEVETYEVAIKQCGYTNKPKNVSEAQFCIPYGVAVSLCDKSAVLEQFTEERIRDARVLDLASKVKVYSSRRFNDQYPKNWGCEVTVLSRAGKEYRKHIVNAKGDHDNPLSFEGLVGKFKGLASAVLPEKKLDEIVDTVMKVETLGDASILSKMLGA
jgi:2-methylcitrate dehydratase PrpD